MPDSFRGIKLSNGYAHQYRNFAATPKAVLAAIAFSFALRITGEENFRDAEKLMHSEWETLYANGIVPQKPLAKKLL